MTLKRALFAGLLAFAGSGFAAQAQTAGPETAVAGQGLKASAPVVSASDAAASFALPYALARVVQTPGQSRTEIDHSFASRGLTGQLGYLCGVEVSAPGSSLDGGPASSFGKGTTFLGAKLVYPFR
jgi:hypothetical protein